MKKKTNLKKGIVAASMVAGLAGGLVAGLALGVPGFAGAQANNASVAIESNASTLAKAATLSNSKTSDTATSDAATASTIPGTVRANSAGDAGEGHDGEGHGPRGPKLEAAAKALGMTAEELKAELMAGKTIAQVATAKGVAISTVTDALVAEFKAHLDEEVASGEHTQAEADAKLAEFTTRVADMVNNVRPAGGPRGMGEGHGPRGMGEGRGPRGGGRDGAMSSAPTLQGGVTTTPAVNA